MDKRFNSIRYGNDFSIDEVGAVRVSKILGLVGRGKFILDLGCGDGFLMERIRAQGNQVMGVEIAENALIKARKKGFHVYDLSLSENWAAQIKEKFDLVVAGEIIEHIFDTDKFLKNIWLILKENGKLIITTPNIASLGRRILLCFGKNPLIEATARGYDAGHIRYFTKDTLLKLLQENHFKVEKVESTVVNFDVNGKWKSQVLAWLFPGLGSTIVLQAKKIFN